MHLSKEELNEDAMVLLCALEELPQDEAEEIRHLLVTLPVLDIFHHRIRNDSVNSHKISKLEEHHNVCRLLLDDGMEELGEHRVHGGCMPLVLLQQIEHVLNHSGIIEARNLFVRCCGPSQNLGSVRLLHLELHLLAGCLGNLGHELHHVVVELHRVGEDSRIMDSGLEVLHNPCQVCHHIILHDRLRESLSDVSHLRGLVIQEDGDSFHLLREHSHDNH
mmetsp:Transcript_44876/g.106480  ORF Transcript_44876/g.106480 Transcript_44876/m.106480 type:complete len:220 (-) Transcript_44876:1486-2145(-)